MNNEHHEWLAREPTAAEVALHEASGGIWYIIHEDSHKGRLFGCVVPLRAADGSVQARRDDSTWEPIGDFATICMCRPFVP